MVSFSCENCGDVLTKKKLDGHRNQCYGASFTCLDCMVHFPGNSYKSHTSCITEDQKYQGKLYKEKKPKGNQQNNNNNNNNSQALAPHKPYAQDAFDTDANAVALVDAPPRAPTPPPAARSIGYSERPALPAVNVFDFLDQSQTPVKPAPADESRMIEDSQPPAYQATDVMNYQVAEEAVRASKEKPDAFTTPAPKKSKSKSRDKDVETTSKKSDRKRKRNSPAELDLSLAHCDRDVSMSDAPPMLHTGLTGGLNKLLARPEFPPSPEDSAEFANSPLSPTKRAKQGSTKKDLEAQQKKDRKAVKKEKKDSKEKEEKKEKERGRERDRKERKASSSLLKVRPKKRREGSKSKTVRKELGNDSPSGSPDRKAVKTIEYNKGSPAPDGNGQLIVRPKGEVAAFGTDARAAMFMSFIDQGSDSDRGVSVNRALKKYHKERKDSSKADSEKELWKNLRLKRNDRGEIVLFFAPPESL